MTEIQRYQGDALSRAESWAALPPEELKRRAARAANARDLEAGEDLTVRATHVINATGVWTDDINDMLGGSTKFEVRPSKGIHIVVPRERIRMRGRVRDVAGTRRPGVALELQEKLVDGTGRPLAGARRRGGGRVPRARWRVVRAGRLRRGGGVRGRPPAGPWRPPRRASGRHAGAGASRPAPDCRPSCHSCRSAPNCPPHRMSSQDPVTRRQR